MRVIRTQSWCRGLLVVSGIRRTRIVIGMGTVRVRGLFGLGRALKSRRSGRLTPFLKVGLN